MISWLRVLSILAVLQFVACQQSELAEDSGVIREDTVAERLASSFMADGRIPSAINLSGVWRIARPSRGYDIQLNQMGGRVEGKGYEWSCSGVFDPFSVEGDYQNGLLSLTVTRSEGAPEYWNLEISNTPDGLTLQRPGAEFRDVLYPAPHLRRLERQP